MWQATQLMKDLVKPHQRDAYRACLNPKAFPQLASDTVYYCAKKIDPLDYQHAIVMIHGMNKYGAKDPRLIHFASCFANRNYPVFVPELPSAMRHAFSMQTEELLLTRLCQSLISQGVESLYLVGISFPGPLAFRIANHKDLKQHINKIFLLAPYFEMQDVAHHFFFNKTSDQYGYFVLIKNILLRQNPVDEPLLKVVNQAIEDSHLGQGFENTNRLYKLLPKDKQRWFEGILFRDYDGDYFAQHFAKEMQSIIDNYHYQKMLPAIECPVFILHGKDDNVISMQQSERLRDCLHAYNKSCELLISELLSHADIKLSLRTVVEALYFTNFMSKFLVQ